MRAEEGDETINDYADEARQAQSKVTRSNARRWLQNAFRLIGSWRGKGSQRGGEHWSRINFLRLRIRALILNLDIIMTDVPAAI